MGNNAAAPDRSSDQSPSPGLVLFTETDAFFNDMLAAIGSARSRVWMETYMFAADGIGWRFAEALAERARAGVEVRLRVDSAGALQSPYSKRIRRYLDQSGVDLRWFNRLRRALPSRLNHRDHRKLLAIDDRYVYVGSSNILQSNSRRLCGDRCTRQLDMRIDGGASDRMAAFATALWQGAEHIETGWQPAPAGESQLVPSSPYNRSRPLRSLYQALFEQAESSVALASGFFVPDEEMVRSVERAAHRGVDVHLILPRHTDMPPTRWAAHALYARLLDAGVHIHEYQPSILHVKAAVVDENWAILGSGNFDFRSFYLNYELNLETRDAAFCRRLHQALDDDLGHCTEIDPATWARRPWRNRVLETLVWPFRRHL